MPTCPKCSQAMAPAHVIDIAGIRGKAVSWQCPSDRIEAVPVHPVQIAHLHLGQEEDRGGRRNRLIHMEMTGAELILYWEVLASTEESHA